MRARGRLINAPTNALCCCDFLRGAACIYTRTVASGLSIEFSASVGSNAKTIFCRCVDSRVGWKKKVEILPSILQFIQLHFYFLSSSCSQVVLLQKIRNNESGRMSSQSPTLLFCTFAIPPEIQ